MSGSTVTGTGAAAATSGCRGAGRPSIQGRPGGRNSGRANASPGIRQSSAGKNAGHPPVRISTNPTVAGATSRAPRVPSRHGPRSSLRQAIPRHRSSSRPSRAGPASCAGWPSGASVPSRHPGPPSLTSVVLPRPVGATNAAGRYPAREASGIDGGQSGNRAVESRLRGAEVANGARQVLGLAQAAARCSRSRTPSQAGSAGGVSTQISRVSD